MAQRGQLVLVRTDPATQFRAAVVQNAAATLDMLPGTGLGFFDVGLSASQSARARLAALSLISVENLTWEVSLWARDTFASPTFTADGSDFLGRVTLTNTTATRIGGAGVYYYYVDGLDVPYVDRDQTSELHLMLIPRSAGKSADDAGAVQIALALEPTLGF